MLRRQLFNASRRLSTARHAHESVLTTLPNGVRVTSENSPGHFVSAGIYIDAGSRYEYGRTSGCSHLLDRLAFKSTSNRTSEEMMDEISKLGGQFISSSSREAIHYQAVSYSNTLPQILSVLSDTVLSPAITSEELEDQRLTTAFEVLEIKQKPEMILPELLHEVAWEGNTLGNPLMCDTERLGTIQAHEIQEYWREWYQPDKILVAAVGVDHEELLKLSERYFGHLEARKAPSNATLNARQSVPPHLLHPSSNNTRPGLFKNLSTFSPSLASVSSLFPQSSPSPYNFSSHPSVAELSSLPARYTGGQVYLPKPDSEFTHLFVGFEGLPVFSPDIYTLATLQVLLGGGGSFSAGGPGKGMYSRLYTNVLNQYYLVDHCASFHHCYRDSGLFGVAISVHPTAMGSAGEIVARELYNVTGEGRGGITETELSRAKNQLKSSMVMALESRLVQCEDLGRQTQTHGRKVSAQEMQERIDEVTVQDIYRVAKHVFTRGEPTILGMGENVETLGDVAGTLKRWGFGSGKVRTSFRVKKKWMDDLEVYEAQKRMMEQESASS
ncbi:LuxS/MPP-like metallohydrolase [Atractiella rhizophila]|nr:LuxS/MPP-like metallohydrolase [Atractiella rhizophila]